MQKVTTEEQERKIKEAIIKKRGYEDPYYFIKYILGFSLLEGIHKEMINFVNDTEGDVLDLEARDHFKSTCISVGYVVWLLVNDNSHKILLNRKKLKKAKETLREIINIFETNAGLRYFYGDMVGKKVWSTSEIILKDSPNGRDANVSIGSPDSPNTGSHYTVIINDDICEYLDRYSAVERENTKRFYKSQVYLKDKGRNGRIINIGTRWHMDDIFAYIMEHEKRVTVRVRSATVDNLPVDDVNAKPYFSSRYSIENLREMRNGDDGSKELFETCMMNNPMMDEDTLFKLEELEPYMYDPESVDYTTGITNAYCDPALSGKQSACSTSLSVGTKIGSDIYLRAWELWKVVPDVSMNNILDVCENESVTELKIESNQAFVMYANDVRAKAESRGLIMSITDAPATQDKIGRIRACGNTIKKHVKFRKDWQDVYPRAMTQLLEFPQSKAIDAPDSLEGLCQMFIQSKSPSIRRIE